MKRDHDTKLLSMKRKSAAITSRLAFCATNMREIDRFVQKVTGQLLRREKQVEALMTENSLLRSRLKKKPRRVPPVEIPFVFPQINDDPVEVMNRKIEELLPVPETLDPIWKGCRTRIVEVTHNCNWHTLAHMFDADSSLDGPSWFKFMRYRNLGEMARIMLAATFKHFKVERKNAPKPENIGS